MVPVMVRSDCSGGGVRWAVFLVLGVLGAGFGRLAAQGAPGFQAGGLEFEGVRYELVRALPSQVRLLWKDGEGTPLGSFEKARSLLLGRGEQPLMIATGGICSDKGAPVGLHVEDGTELAPLNMGDGEGNFFLKPNGVFLIRDTGKGREAIIWPSSIYSSWQKVRKEGDDLPVFATQSGPLLLTEEGINPRLDPESTSRLGRSGVGIDADGRVVFALTAEGQRVSLHGFARFFESLGCREALCLNGDVARMAVELKGPVAGGVSGSLLAVVVPLLDGGVIVGETPNRP
jgi:uncharacterized protein YigE (DUF2233 family)